MEVKLQWPAVPLRASASCWMKVVYLHSSLDSSFPDPFFPVSISPNEMPTHLNPVGSSSGHYGSFVSLKKYFISDYFLLESLVLNGCRNKSLVHRRPDTHRTWDTIPEERRIGRATRERSGVINPWWTISFEIIRLCCVCKPPRQRRWFLGERYVKPNTDETISEVTSSGFEMFCCWNGLTLLSKRSQSVNCEGYIFSRCFFKFKGICKSVLFPVFHLKVKKHLNQLQCSCSSSQNAIITEVIVSLWMQTKLRWYLPVH